MKKYWFSRLCLGGVIAIYCFFGCSNLTGTYDKVEYKVMTDSFGVVIDTIYRADFKFNNKGHKIFKKLTSYYADMVYINESFFDSRGQLVLEESKILGDSGFMRYEVFKNQKGVIDSAYQIDGTDFPKIDTIIILYQRMYERGKLNNLELRYIGFDNSSSILSTRFNKNEREIDAILISDGKTLTYDTFIYNDTTLFQIIHYNYIGDSTKSVMYYNKEEYPVREEIFDLSTSMKVREIDQYYDANGDKMKSVEFDYVNRDSKYYEFVIITF
ncbi:hypothetical protein [Neolewinella agarilytica]|uniref:Uncharacterized protein n=1 Tax=Neolewinella agarilytica TaxID=478744 RepID=A0A1H9PDU8_9BACT|nr:hypothetical protein [Neolewinella agarilytica]SER46332.1 hypothetical protein SAMN05444359_1475 [Neolewinella agarilytica]